MRTLIDKLTELRKKTTKGEWVAINSEEKNTCEGSWINRGGITEKIGDKHNDIWDGSDGAMPDYEEIFYIVALHNAFPLIKQHFEATERFMEVANAMIKDHSGCGGECSAVEELYDALAEFRKAIKD